MAEAKKPIKKKIAGKAEVSEKLQTKKKATTKVEAAAKGKEQENGTAKESIGTESQTDSQERQVDTPVIAKAGKRSEKALKEAEEKQAKEVRKAQATEGKSEAVTKVQQKPARTLLERKGKKFRKLAEQLEPGKTYGIKEALKLAVTTSPVKFDATVEVHVRLGIDPRQADQNLRDTIVLPAGTGKSLRVAVFADADGITAAKKAGAEVAGSDEFLQQLDKEVIDFDILVATPAMMPRLGKYARLLGPKGLMPNPKSGTVATDVAKAVKEAKAGRLEYRVDSTGIIHAGIGKVSFGGEKLLQNGLALFNSIKSNKPSSLKGTYVKSIFVTTSMGPSISVDIAEI